jgi:hypothetical protein
VPPDDAGDMPAAYRQPSMTLHRFVSDRAGLPQPLQVRSERFDRRLRRSAALRAVASHSGEQHNSFSGCLLRLAARNGYTAIAATNFTPRAPERANGSKGSQRYNIAYFNLTCVHLGYRSSAIISVVDRLETKPTSQKEHGHGRMYREAPREPHS